MSGRLKTQFREIKRLFETYSVGHSLTLSLHLLHLVAQTGVGDVALPVLVTEQTTAVQLNTREEEEGG